MGQMDLKQVGPITRYTSNFKTDFLKTAKECHQTVNVKFDQLNREILEYVRDHGCKILHLSSHVFDYDKLCIEGPLGLVEYMNVDLLYSFLMPNNSE